MTSVFSPLRIVVIFILLTVTAGALVSQLSVTLVPPQKSSTLSISFSLPNSSPSLLEQHVTSTIEDACAGLSQLKSITSRSGYNAGTVVLQFDEKADLQFKRLEITAILRQIMPALPAGVPFPVITGDGNGTTEQSPLLVYSVNGPFQPFHLKKETGEVFRKQFTGYNSISDIKITGSANLQMTIRFDKAKCNAYHIAPAAVIDQLGSSLNTSYPGVATTQTGDSYFLHLRHLSSVPDIEKKLLITGSGRGIYLKDIATLHLEEQQREEYFRINGQNAILVSIYAQPGENRILLNEQTKHMVQEATAKLPAGYKVQLEYDDMRYVQQETNRNYLRAGFSVCILMLCMLLFYRNIYYLLSLMGGLTASLSLTLLLACLFGIGIHIYTIAGLAISFGLIMDNSIIMLDHYHRNRNTKIFTTLTGATVTTVAVLLLIFFLPEKERINLTDFVIIVIIALISSLFSSLLFIPGCNELTRSLYTDGVFSGKQKNSFTAKRRKIKIVRCYSRVINVIANHRKTFITACILCFGLPIFMLPPTLDGNAWYARCYNATLGCDFYLENIRPVVDRYTGGVLRPFLRNVPVNGVNMEPENTRLMVTAALPFGNTPDQMDALLKNFETYLMANPAIDKYITHIYNGQSGSIEVIFKKEFEQSNIPNAMKSLLIRHSLDLGGVELNIYGIGNGFTNARNIEISKFRVVMKGYNYNELEKQAKELADRLQKHNRVQKINTDDELGNGEKKNYTYTLLLDPVLMAAGNTDQFTLLQQLQEFSALHNTSSIIIAGEAFYPLSWKVNISTSHSMFDLLNKPLSTGSGKQIKIKDIGKLEMQTTASSIYKENRQYVRIVSFEYAGLERFGDAYLNEILAHMKHTMPDGYTAEKLSINNSWIKEGHNYYLIGLVFVLIFFVCSILFNNFKDPLHIIMLIPIGFIGLFGIFALGEFEFDRGGYAAFIILGGLIANAAIFVISDFNQLKYSAQFRQSGNKLLIKAITIRSRTILLTTVSTCCGLIPFIIASQTDAFWFSFSIGTMGGMAGLCFAIFLVLPVLLYKKPSLAT